MTLLVLHLSDIHLDKDSEGFVARAESIVAAALSQLLKYKFVHIVYSGDVANKDAPRDFIVVRKFIEAISKAVERRVGIVPVVVLSPGNHDADFSGDQSVRDILISSLRQGGGTVSPAVIDQIASVLAPFKEFQREVMPKVEHVSPWYSRFAPEDGSGLNYLLFNSSLTSTKKEEAAKLYFPIDSVERLAEGRTIAVMHHPLGWFMPDNAREIAQLMPRVAHLVLMGHEHVSVGHHVRDIYDGSSVYYLKANVLQESSEPAESAFQVIELDKDSGFTPRSYRWSGSAYVPWAERTQEEMIVWPEERGSGRFSLTPDCLRGLRSAGASYSHRRKSSITLEDIFVWPNLRPMGDDRDPSLHGPEQLLDARELLDSSGALSSVIVIKGGEQSGKSALARMLTLQLNKRGLTSLLLGAATVSSWREKSLNQRLVSAIDEMYGRDSRDAFHQLDPRSRVLVIDNFDLRQVTDGYFEGLKLLRQQFGRVFLMLDSHPGMEIALNEFLSDENFLDSEVYDLVACTQAKRLEIIERWLEIGQPDDVGPGATKLMAAKFLKVVDETLGRNLIPSLPVFVLIVLQRAELEQDLDTVVKSGSHGFLYESMIRQALSTKVTASGLVATLSYLTAFAGECDSRGVDGLAKSDFDDFHQSHCRRFQLQISLEKLLAQLVDADIFDSRTGVIRFRYPFHYYYFLARWLSGIDDWSKLEPRINEMVESIHTEKNANVLLFLAHLGRSPRIHEKILVSAKKMFAQFGGGADVFSPPGVLVNSRPQDIRAVMLEGRVHDQLEDRAQDEKDDEAARSELTAAAESRLRSRLDDALKMNAAFKTLQVLGQVLRNHAGEIEREEKQDMAETCVVLGLRVLQFIYETIADHGDELILFRADQIKAGAKQAAEKKRLKVAPKGLSEGELAEQLAGYLPSFVSSVTVGTVIKIANAIGCEDLAPTIDAVLRKGGTRQLIRLATKLEHFSDFPMHDVIAFDDDHLKSNDVLAGHVMRRFLVRRFQLFPVRDELKRPLLTRFSISAKPFLFLPQKDGGGSG